MKSLNPTPPSGTLLLDSNVLIDVLRGERPALEWLQGHGSGAAIRSTAERLSQTSQAPEP
jgi:predicted nucleic acid-binding protein